MALSAGTTANVLAARMAKVVPGGVNSNVRLEVADVFFDHGQGALLWDTEGRDYVDYVLGQGPAFLGHGRGDLAARISDAIGGGLTFGAQTAVELEAAEALVETLGWADMVRIGMTSTETVQAALRVARAATGRRRFIRFRGHYHGWIDNVLLNSGDGWPSPASDGQLPEALDQSITLEWNDIAALRHVVETAPGEVAAVLMEPMMLNAGAILPSPGYLEAVRDLCRAHGIVLIFDETITGFRLGLQGAAGRFAVTPDLAIYGKAVAGGYPASVLAGRADLMARFAAGTNHSGTFNANVLSCAAIVAALDVMRATDVHAVVESTGGQLMDGLRALGEELGLPLRIRGLPAAFHAAFDEDAPVRCYADLQHADSARYRRLVVHARAAGVWLTGRGVWYVSVAHDEATSRLTIDRMRVALTRLRDEEAAAA